MICDHCGREIRPEHIRLLRTNVLEALRPTGRSILSYGTRESRASWNAIHSTDGTQNEYGVLRGVARHHAEHVLKDREWCCQATASGTVEKDGGVARALFAKIRDMREAFLSERVRDVEKQVRQLIRCGIDPDRLLRIVQDATIEEVHRS